MKNINANMLLCKEYDKENGNISEIFNTIYINEEEEKTFDIALFLEGRNCPFKKLHIIYLIYRVEDFKNKKWDDVKILAKTESERTPGKKRSDGKGRECTFEDSFASSINIRIPRIKFRKSGVYEIRAYGYIDKEKDEIISMTAEQLVIDTENLLGMVNFEVRDV